MFYKPLLLLAIFVCLCASANGQTVSKDAWMNYAQQMYSETTAPLPHYVLGKLVTETKQQPVLYQGGTQRSPLSGLGAVAFLVGLIGALADPANADQWWTVCLIGLAVYLLF